MGTLFDDYFKNQFNITFDRALSYSNYFTDKKDDDYYVAILAPGCTKKDVAITLESSTDIKVTYKIKILDTVKDLTKAFKLPINVTEDSVSAKVENGIIEIKATENHDKKTKIKIL